MTNDHRDLVQREIDGLNTASESERLADLMTSNQEVNQAFEELTAVRIAFDSLTEKTPSPDLRASIMNALPALPVQRTQTHERSSIWDSIRAIIAQPKPVALVYAFSTGLIASFLIWTIAFTPAVNPGDPALVGTMAPSGSTVIYEAGISADSDMGTVHATWRNGQLRIEVRWTGERGARAIVTYNPDVLFATAVESVMGRSSLATITRTEESVEYVTGGSSTDITTLVYLDGQKQLQESEVHVRISANGMTPAEHVIPVVRNN